VSAYIVLGTPMTDEECLLEALADVGFAGDRVEVHAEPVCLQGYEGRLREQVAHVVIRRKHLGGSSNDIGFLRTPTGYQALVSGYDSIAHGAGWLQTLQQRYAVRHAAKVARLAEAERLRLEEERRQLVESQRQAIRDKARKMGYRVEETREGDAVRLVLLKRVY